jgi:hypothetical protein
LLYAVEGDWKGTEQAAQSTERGNPKREYVRAPLRKGIRRNGKERAEAERN